MGKLSKVIVPLIAATSIVLSLYSFYLEDLRKVRIDQAIELLNAVNNRQDSNLTKTDSLRNEIIQLQFERQSYTANIDLMSNWFILFETILFGIFFIVGYGIFDNKITESKKENEDAYKNIHERYVHFEKEFRDLKISSLKDSAKLYETISQLSPNVLHIREYLDSKIEELKRLVEVNKLEAIPGKLNGCLSFR